MKKLVALLPAFSLILAVAGCSEGYTGKDIDKKKDILTGQKDGDKQEEKEKPEEQRTPVEVYKPSEPDDETKLKIKAYTYIAFSNEILELAEDLDEYFLVVEPQEEFAFTAQNTYDYKYGIGPYNTDMLDNAVTLAKEEPALDPLDELTLKIEPYARELMDVFSDMYSCYDFADGQYAKAKEMHKRIVAVLHDFYEQADAYLYECGELSDKLAQESEQKALEDGNIIFYSSSHMITLCKELFRVCNEKGIDDSNLTSLDLSAVQPIIDEMHQTFDQYTAAVNDKNQLMKESLAGPPINYFTSLMSTIDFMTEIIKNGGSNPSPGALGSLGHINEVLNDFIDNYNRIEWTAD